MTDAATPEGQQTPQQVAARASVLLSAQRALLGEVTPELRGVLVSWAAPPDVPEPAWIEADFYYDREIEDDDADHVSEVEGYVAADFLPDVDVRFSPLHLSGSRPLPQVAEKDLATKVWVYRRFEE